ncbi:TetR/AcrR family transcriptional regulator [Lactococcus protaetiae]|uniref:TetR family transcriptional regulator n=1 Tax=Lactococcus protaetiae TaxID=2592653 RepID=A0A514Z5Y1_9LACT|nr:TetR/AcrR family transcriptional regulator [Lactococcus protaetiae]MCL2113042.1 TetR/AcrR family transcriptional regulator [Streptococcaceae bacterium]QDK70014.1 TetR family transcriptional regulator [Lactococcus protaetiae]
MKSKEKLQIAATKLFMEKGYENTTVQEISSLAGVTERTFFRQFKDKSDVLFDSENHLGKQVASYISEYSSDTLNPLKLAVSGFAATTLFDKNRERALSRTQIVNSHPDLIERELLKAQTLIASVENALSPHFDSSLSALSARFSVEIFHLAFVKWTHEKDKKFSEQIWGVYDTYKKLIELP